MALVVQHPAISAMDKKGKKDKKDDVGIEDSSFLQAASYDGKSQLTITMKSGSVYTYQNVDPSKFESFKQSKNKGKFYADQIKGVETGTRTVDKTIGPRISKKA